MKSTSKKSTGLLGGFDFQPIFSEKTLSRSGPKEEEVSQAKPNEAEQAPIKPSEATDSHAQPNEAQLSNIKPKQAKDSETGEGSSTSYRTRRCSRRTSRSWRDKEKNPDAGIASGRCKWRWQAFKAHYHPYERGRAQVHQP